MQLRNIVYKSPNLIIQHIQKNSSNTSNIAIIVGNGHSVSLDDNNNVTFSDPLYHPEKSVKDYGNNCSVFIIYYPDTCEGLDVSGKELAEFINANLQLYKKIILHGHSKCGVCFLNLAQYLDKWAIFRTCIVAVSAPLKGTPFADVHSFSKSLNPIEKFVYSKIFSNHWIDMDICPSSNFLNNFTIPTFTNLRIEYVVSKCSASINPIDFLLWLICLRTKINGDGIVPLNSQIPDGIYYQIKASHATSFKKSCKIVKRIMAE